MTIRTPSDLGALIRQRRTRLGLDQSSLAKQAGTSRKWLIEVENGKSRAEIGLILRTLKTLGIALRETAAENLPKKRAKNAAYAINIDRVLSSLQKRG